MKRNLRELLDLPERDWNPRRHGNLLYFLWPNTLVPEAPATEKALHYFEKNNAILYSALEEDFAMAARVQAGIQAGASDRLWHGRFEQALRWFHQGLDEALGERRVGGQGSGDSLRIGTPV